MNRIHMIVLAALLLGVPAAHSQTTEPDDAKRPLGRFSVGGKVHVLFNDLMNNETATTSTSEPPVQTSLGTNSTSSRLGGGATVEFAIFDNISVSADILYRKVGYKTGEDIIEGIDDEETEDEDERLFTQRFEGTKANYWEVPVVARFYTSSWRERDSKAFVEAGAAVRRVGNIQTFREVIYPDDSNEVDQTPVEPVRRILPGIVLGGGLVFPGSAGIKVMPSVRYTRWFATTFDSPPTRSAKNQFEFVLGIMF